MNLFIAQGSKSHQCLAKDTKPISEKGIGITFQAQAKPRDTEHIPGVFHPSEKTTWSAQPKESPPIKGPKRFDRKFHDTIMTQPS